MNQTMIYKMNEVYQESKSQEKSTVQMTKALKKKAMTNEEVS